MNIFRAFKYIFRGSAEQSMKPPAQKPKRSKSVEPPGKPDLSSSMEKMAAREQAKAIEKNRGRSI